jgi:type IV pilus assembly protein PilF
MSKGLLGVVLPSLLLSACVGVGQEKNVRLSDIHRRLAVHELHQNRPQGALRELMKALQFDPENPDAHYTMAFLLQGRRDTEKALEHLRTAIKLRPDFADAHNNLGTLLLELGRHADAMPHFKKALSVVTYATPYLPHGNLGWAHHKLGDNKAAIRSLKTALFHNPKFCLGHNNLGIVYAADKQPALARHHWEKALTLCPKYVEPHYRLGLSHLEEKRRDLAVVRFQACEQLSPESQYGQECGRYNRLLK